MTDLEMLENERNQQTKIQCIDYATRIVGKPAYITEDGKVQKYQDDVIQVATKIHDFVTSK